MHFDAFHVKEYRRETSISHRFLSLYFCHTTWYDSSTYMEYNDTRFSETIEVSYALLPIIKARGQRHECTCNTNSIFSQNYEFHEGSAKSENLMNPKHLRSYNYILVFTENVSAFDDIFWIWNVSFHTDKKVEPYGIRNVSCMRETVDNIKVRKLEKQCFVVCSTLYYL